MSLIESVLPAGMTAVELVESDGGTLADLLPAERAVLTGAGRRRRADFVSARWCAHAALDQLGVPAAPLLPGALGAPAWPLGVIGSITHTIGYRAAVATRRGPVRGVGIDAEPAGPIPPALHERITTDSEREHQRALADAVPELPWGRILFTAKESLYKAWWPMTQRQLGFRGAAVAFQFDDAPGTSTSGPFVATLTGPHDGRRLAGRWLVSNGFVLAGVADPWVAAAETSRDRDRSSRRGRS